MKTNYRKYDKSANLTYLLWIIIQILVRKLEEIYNYKFKIILKLIK